MRILCISVSRCIVFICIRRYVSPLFFFKCYLEEIPLWRRFAFVHQFIVFFMLLLTRLFCCTSGYIHTCNTLHIRCSGSEVELLINQSTPRRQSGINSELGIVLCCLLLYLEIKRSLVSEEEKNAPFCRRSRIGLGYVNKGQGYQHGRLPTCLAGPISWQFLHRVLGE